MKIHCVHKAETTHLRFKQRLSQNRSFVRNVGMENMKQFDVRFYTRSCPLHFKNASTRPYQITKAIFKNKSGIRSCKEQVLTTAQYTS